MKMNMNIMKDWSLLKTINADIKENIAIVDNKKGFTVKNNNNEAIWLYYNKKITEYKNTNNESLELEFLGKSDGSGACLFINEVHSVPMNSKVSMEINSTGTLNIRLRVDAETKVEIEKLEIEFLDEKKDLFEAENEKNDVLVICPNYPSYENLYNCAFAHSRVREYINNGLNVQVASINPYNWYQTKYDFDGVSVFRGGYQDLKKLLSRKQYKVILTHFVDEYLYPIFDGYITNERLIFICHGPETVFRYLEDVTRPYFTNHIEKPNISDNFYLKESYVKKYSQKDNVEWVFVSDWLKDFSESQLGIKFKHSRVINNLINEDLFPYVEKTEEDRKKILILRKFDNIIQHSIDQSVLAILELSRKPYFKELEIEVYGDGNFYEELITPLKQFDNVNFHKTFIPNNRIHEVYEKSGIILLPSRHDAHAVAMGESAASGLVVVGSTVTSNPFFMNNDKYHTLCDPEDYMALAGIIDRLYNNPQEFLEISRGLSKETRERCCKSNTVLKEVKLINEMLEKPYKIAFSKSTKSSKPILTIVVPAYNVENYLDKCLFSLVNHRNAHLMEVLVVNDGSKDNTAKIAKKYEKITNGIVKLINKENGGHGSTINKGIELATGKYFRLIDGDDWVDSNNLAMLIDILKNEKADIVLTKGSYEYVEEAKLVDIIDYNMLNEGVYYHFEDLIYPQYGFKEYGPLLTTGNYKTELLKKANFKISEKKPYVDMEFNSFSLKYVDTLVYYKLDIYRYLIGRDGQTISRDFWKRKYKDHEYIIFNILKNISKNEDFSKQKKVYIYNHIIAQMVDSQIFMFDALCAWEEIEEFLKELEQWPEAYNASLNYINNKSGNCELILLEYKKYIKKYKKQNARNSIIVPGKYETKADLNIQRNKHFKWYIKKGIKAVTPYIILREYQKRKNR